jgi:CRISPR/Cas system-associated exonuclease Cas4 (RecB family)
MFQQNFKINYYPLIRNKESIEDFFNQITRLIDILEQVKSPKRKPDCKICSDYERNLIVEGSS